MTEASVAVVGHVQARVVANTSAHLPIGVMGLVSNFPNGALGILESMGVCTHV